MEELEELRQAVLYHHVCESLVTIDTLIIFMINHVFSVWTFMCLLKALISRLTVGVSSLWHPCKHPKAMRILLEILLEEETDLVDGVIMSHFELYMKSMQEINAPCTAIQGLLDRIRQGDSIDIASIDIASIDIASIDIASIDIASIDIASLVGIQPETKEYIHHHLEIIQTWPFEDMLIYFTFGRELLIPHMFTPILRCIQEHHLHCPLFEYYIQHHIHLDVIHGDKMLNLLGTTIDTDKYRFIIQQAYSDRKLLWDGILQAIRQ